MKTPIIIVHFSSSSKNINLVVRHLLENNPGRRIILISDRSIPVAGLEFYNLNDFSDTANKFAKKYIHLSSNRYDFELFALQRWFIIDQLVRTIQINRFIAIDPDVMFFVKIKEFEKIFASNKNFTISHAACPHIFYVKSYKDLSNFLMFIEDWYDTKANKLRARYKEEFVKHNKKGGIGDMTFLNMYVSKYPEHFADIAIPVRSCVCDHSMLIPDGYLFDVKRKIKKLSWKKGIPYVTDAKNKQIKLLAIHFQGNAKRLIPEFYYSGLRKYIFFLKNRAYETLLNFIKG